MTEAPGGLSASGLSARGLPASALPASALPAGLELQRDVPLAARTTLRIGGPARYFAGVKDVGQLKVLLRFAREAGLPVLPLGKGSNLLIPDGGFPGVVFVLGGELISFRIEKELVRSGGGVSLMALAVATRNASLSGLENLSGIPSTLGGAIRINAGAYGSEVFDLLVDVTLVDRSGEARVVPSFSIASGYRWSALVETADIVAAATLRLVRRPREEIETRLAEVRERRKASLPVEPNAGSVFKNPPGDYAGRLLEACGMKGLRVGGAEISERHANVIVNRGEAREADVRALMAAMRDAVADRFGFVLEPELELVGGPLPEAGSAAHPTGAGPRP